MNRPILCDTCDHTDRDHKFGGIGACYCGCDGPINLERTSAYTEHYKGNLRRFDIQLCTYIPWLARWSELCMVEPADPDNCAACFAYARISYLETAGDDAE